MHMMARYDCMPLHRAVRKYGKENFTIDLIEECPDELLNDRECYWINKLNATKTGYNLLPGGLGGNKSRVRKQDGRTEYLCSQCGSKFKRYAAAIKIPIDNVVCSAACRGNAIKGSKNPGWKGGKTLPNLCSVCNATIGYRSKNCRKCSSKVRYGVV